MQNSKILKLKAQRAKQHRLVSQERHTQEIEALSDVKESIKDLYSLINDQEKFDPNKLSEQIETLAKSLDIQDQVASIKEVLSTLNPQVTVEKVDLAPLLKAIESNKPKDIDLSKLEKAIIEVRQRVQESSVVEQAPEEFQPVRRVVKVGNRLIFDDQPTTASRAGGGGSSSSSSSGGLTDTELRDSPVEVTEAIATIDTNNSTTATLGSSGVFTGTATDVTDYEAVLLMWKSDKASATNGLQFQSSSDGTNWDDVHSYTTDAGVARHYEETLPAKYFRIVYTNTNSLQTYFRMQVKLLKRPASAHVHPIDYAIDTGHPAAIGRSVITGQTTAGGGALVNVKVNPSGTLETNATISSLPNEGQQTMANSISVAVASNQTDIPISASALPLPSGASTSAKQETAQTSLNTLVTDIDYRYSGGKTAYVTTLAASGGTTLIDPAPGNAIRVFWAAFVPNSDNTAANLIKLGFGSGTTVSTEIYRGYALAHWEVFTGAANENLNVNASSAEPVALTIHYQEITP